MVLINFVYLDLDQIQLDSYGVVVWRRWEVSYQRDDTYICTQLLYHTYLAWKTLRESLKTMYRVINRLIINRFKSSMHAFLVQQDIKLNNKNMLFFYIMLIFQNGAHGLTIFLKHLEKITQRPKISILNLFISWGMFSLASCIVIYWCCKCNNVYFN